MTFALVRVGKLWKATCVACLARPLPMYTKDVVVTDDGIGFEGLGTWLAGHKRAHELVERDETVVVEAPPVCTVCNEPAVVKCRSCIAAACEVHRLSILKTLPGHRETSFVEVRT